MKSRAGFAVRTLFALGLFGFGSPALAAEPPLEALIREVWRGSPQLRAQEVQADLAQGDRWRRFVFNEPQLQYTNADDRSTVSYGLQLSTGFPGKSLALARLDAAKARGQRAEYQARRHDLARATAQAYLDCAAAQATYELQAVTSEDLETVFQALKARYETGHSTQAEKIGAELQARQAQLDRQTARDRQEVLCRKLLSFLTASGARIGHGKLALQDDVDPSLIAELGSVTADQSRAEAAGDTADANSSTAWWAQLPDLTLGVARNHYVYLPASPAGKPWTTTFGVSVTLPLLFPFHETVEARRARSQAAIDLNAAELQRSASDSDRLDAAREYQRSRVRLRELRTRDLPLGDALVDSTYSAYRSGKLGYAELVLSRRTLTDLRAQEIQLRVAVTAAHLRCLSRCEVDPTDSSTQDPPP